VLRCVTVLYNSFNYCALHARTTYFTQAPRTTHHTPRTAQLFVIIGMICGACFFAFVVGTCCSLIESLDDISLRFQEQLAMINDYMEVSDTIFTSIALNSNLLIF
jgi:hypothetical protein